MAQFQSTKRLPTHVYPSARPHYSTQYPAASDIYYSHQYGESSSSGSKKNKEALSKLQAPSDLPDLYFDYDQPSPPSATALNIISTPPLQEEWAAEAATAATTQWQENSSPDAAYAPYASFISPSNWDASGSLLGQATSGATAPVDPSFAWVYQTQSGPAKTEFTPNDIIQPSTSYDEYDQLMTAAGALDASYYTSYPSETGHDIPHSSTNTLSMTDFVYSIDPSASLAASSSPSSAQVLPTSLFSPGSSSVIVHTAPPSASYPSPPPTAAPHQEPLKIHQPRPSRRIPIISLSNLASACDTSPIYSTPQEPTGGNSAEVKPAVTSLGRTRRQDTKPYLPITSHRSNTQYKSSRQHSHSSHGVYHPAFPVGINSDSGQVVRCPCGCMQSYICH